MLYVFAREDDHGIKVREYGHHRRISKVIGRHINGLHRSNAGTFSGLDALMEFTYLADECRLIPCFRRDPAQERGKLSAGLGKPEHIIDEKQDGIVIFLD